MTALIAIKGGRKGAYVDSLPNSPSMPTRLSGEDLNILRPEVMLFIGGMLHDGGFEGAGSSLGGRVVEIRPKIRIYLSLSFPRCNTSQTT